MADVSTDEGGSELSQKDYSAEDPTGRCDGGQGGKNQIEVVNVVTRSGRLVKPSAVVRESTSDSSRSNNTPIKRKTKSSGHKSRSAK